MAEPKVVGREPIVPNQRSRRRLSWRAWAVWVILGTGLAACATVGTWAPLKNYHRTAEVQGATRTDSGECRVCHEDVNGYAPSPVYHGDCESCHGNGSLHNASEAVADIRHPSSGDCLACHGPGRTTHMSWDTGDHSRAGVICSDCHNPHNRELFNVRVVKNVGFARMDDYSQLCSSCHLDIASRLNFPSHHPVKEGTLSCVSCHDPHEDSRTTLGHPTSDCATCHQDHVGPWVFEHMPATEDCTTCHDPHGSPSDDLLAISQPSICITCHSTSDDRHMNAGEGLTRSTDTMLGDSITDAVSFSMYGRCTDCHGAIHGSYQDPHLRR
jgi:DmsE family decaheme c-type cytochrome